MGLTPLLLRVCAVCSSLLLVATFVAHRSGALAGWLPLSTAQAAAPQAESGDDARPRPPAVMGGTKSLVLATPPEERPTPREPRPRPRPRATATEATPTSTPTPPRE